MLELMKALLYGNHDNHSTTKLSKGGGGSGFPLILTHEPFVLTISNLVVC